MEYSFGCFSPRAPSFDDSSAEDPFTPPGFKRGLLECTKCINRKCINEWCAKGGPGGKPLLGGSRCDYCKQHFKCKCTCLQETCYNHACINIWCQYKVGSNRCDFCQEHYNCQCHKQASAALPALPVLEEKNWNDWEEALPGCQCPNPTCQNRLKGTCSSSNPCKFCSRHPEKWCKCAPPNCPECGLAEVDCLCQVCVNCEQVYGVDGTVCNCNNIAEQMSIQETDPYSILYIEGVLDEKPYTRSDYFASRENGKTVES